MKAETGPAPVESIEDVYRERYRRFCSIALRYLHFRDEAEEAVQEGFLRAWERRDQHRDASPLRAWVRQIIVNECLDRLRRRKARLVSGAVPLDRANEPVEQPTIVEMINRHQQRALTVKLLIRLPRRARAHVSRVLAGEEIDLRVPANKSRQHRAVIQLRQAVLTRQTAIL